MRLSEEQKKRVMALAQERDEAGRWRYSIDAIARMFDVTRAAIVYHLRHSGFPPRHRWGWGKKPKRAKIVLPPEMERWRTEIIATHKISKREATRIIIEHMRVRGIHANAA